jgi:hypothetical protein
MNYSNTHPPRENLDVDDVTCESPLVPDDFFCEPEEIVGCVGGSPLPSDFEESKDSGSDDYVVKSKDEIQRSLDFAKILLSDMRSYVPAAPPSSEELEKLKALASSVPEVRAPAEKVESLKAQASVVEPEVQVPVSDDEVIDEIAHNSFVELLKSRITGHTIGSVFMFLIIALALCSVDSFFVFNYHKLPVYLILVHYTLLVGTRLTSGNTKPTFFDYSLWFVTMCFSLVFGIYSHFFFSVAVWYFISRTPRMMYFYSDRHLSFVQEQLAFGLSESMWFWKLVGYALYYRSFRDATRRLYHLSLMKSGLSRRSFHDDLLGYRTEFSNDFVAFQLKKVRPVVSADSPYRFYPLVSSLAGLAIPFEVGKSYEFCTVLNVSLQSKTNPFETGNPNRPESKNDTNPAIQNPGRTVLERKIDDTHHVSRRGRIVETNPERDVLAGMRIVFIRRKIFYHRILCRLKCSTKERRAFFKLYAEEHYESFRNTYPHVYIACHKLVGMGSLDDYLAATIRDISKWKKEKLAIAKDQGWSVSQTTRYLSRRQRNRQLGYDEKMMYTKQGCCFSRSGRPVGELFLSLMSGLKSGAKAAWKAVSALAQDIGRIVKSGFTRLVNSLSSLFISIVGSSLWSVLSRVLLEISLLGSFVVCLILAYTCDSAWRWFFATLALLVAFYLGTPFMAIAIYGTVEVSKQSNESFLTGDFFVPLIKDFKNFNIASVTVEKFTKLVTFVVDHAHFLAKGYPYSDSANRALYDKMSKWIASFETTRDDFQTNRSRAAARAVIEVNRVGESLNNALLGVKLNSTFIAPFTSARSACNLLCVEANAILASKEGRPQPVGVLIMGPPGTGKDVFVRRVAPGLAQAIEKSTVPIDVADALFYIKTVESTRFPGDGYWGQPIASFQDLAINKEKKIVSEDVIHLMDWVNEFPVELNASNLNDKSQKFTASRVVFATTNLCSPFHLACDIRDVRAFYRRFSLIYYAANDPFYSAGTSQLVDNKFIRLSFDGGNYVYSDGTIFDPNEKNVLPQYAVLTSQDVANQIYAQYLVHESMRTLTVKPLPPPNPAGVAVPVVPPMSAPPPAPLVRKYKPKVKKQGNGYSTVHISDGSSCPSHVCSSARSSCA